MSPGSVGSAAPLVYTIALFGVAPDPLTVSAQGAEGRTGAETSGMAGVTRALWLTAGDI